MIPSIAEEVFRSSPTCGAVGPAHLPMLIRKGEIFLEALNNTKDGSALEIGVMYGDVSLICMEIMLQTGKIRPIQTVDFYMIAGYQDEYLIAMNSLILKANSLYEASKKADIWKHFNVLDHTYMYDVYPFLLYEDYKKYFFIHLDGPHDYESVWKEYMFFKDKLIPGGIIIIDDVGVQDGVGIDILADWGREVETIHNGIVLRSPA